MTDTAAAAAVPVDKRLRTSTQGSWADLSSESATSISALAERLSQNGTPIAVESLVQAFKEMKPGNIDTKAEEELPDFSSPEDATSTSAKPRRKAITTVKARVAVLERIVEALQQEHIKNKIRIVPSEHISPHDFHELRKQIIPTMISQNPNVAQVKLSRLHFDLDLKVMLDTKTELDRVRNIIKEHNYAVKTVAPLTIERNLENASQRICYNTLKAMLLEALD